MPFGPWSYFLLVIFVLGKFAWGPLLSGLQQREEFIRRSLQEAKDDREAAEARLQEYEEKLSGAGDRSFPDRRAGQA